ncbi:MAG: Gfo/Idh/MocA family oxidoreductase [Pirellulales bacterium]
MQRRRFLKAAGVGGTFASLTALSASRVYGAGERVRLGWIGCGGRGRFVAERMRRVEGVEIVAACDVYQRNRERAAQWAGPRCQADDDFRRVLDRGEVDAVLVATPDHWHAIPTVLACQAGKDVYVEKPLGHNIREGRATLDAARRHQRIVQLGTQQRSAPHFERMREIIQSGVLGPVHMVRIWNYRNEFPRGLGRRDDSAVPEGLDWDFYLGPAPQVAFNQNRFLGSFRWFYDYAGGMITDWGTHRFDSMHHVMQVDIPRSVAATGGCFELHDGRDTPDVLQATYEYPGFILSYETCMLNAQGTGPRTPSRDYYRANGPDDRPNGLAFYGTNGTILADRLGFEVYPELQPGRKADSRDAEVFRMPREEASSPDSTELHCQNFIDCVRSRARPAADVEIGHRSSIVPHLGNIAYRTGRKLQWDAEKEEITGDVEASRLLGREAREPWDLLG